MAIAIVAASAKIASTLIHENEKRWPATCLMAGIGCLSEVADIQLELHVRIGEASNPMATHSADQAEPSHFDWREPPFAGGRCGARVDLRPIARGGWLTPLQSATAFSEKQALLSERPAQCGALWATTGALAALRRGEQLLAQQMSDAGLTTGSSVPTDPTIPLLAAALQVHEDLCLMWRVGGSYCLLAANLCRPSYWSLADKLGCSLLDIHAGVTDLTGAQRQRMQSVFDKLPSERVFERRNWFMHSSGAGFEPQPDSMEYADYPGPWFLRSERQTLRRLDTDMLLFAIRVDIEPLERVQHHHQARDDLLIALRALDDTALQDFGGADKRAAALNAVLQLRSSDAAVNA